MPAVEEERDEEADEEAGNQYVSESAASNSTSADRAVVVDIRHRAHGSSRAHETRGAKQPSQK